LLYHDEATVNEYLKNKSDYPQGVLFKTFGKDRLRTMYKADKLEPGKVSKAASFVGLKKK